jgi:hypothetical protein
MRKISRILAALALAASVGQAATIRVGMNSTKFRIDPEPEMGELTFGHGLHLSVTREVPRSYGAVTAGIGYEKRSAGSEFDETVEDDYYTYTITGESSINLTYLTVPVGVQFEDRLKPGGRGYLALRMVPSILLEAKGKAKFRVVDGDGDVIFSARESEDIKDDVAPFDLVAEAEVGYSVPFGAPTATGRNRFLIGAAVGYGLFYLDDSEEEEDEYYDEDLEEDAPTIRSLIVRVFVGVTF